jgi:putative membrane protein
MALLIAQMWGDGDHMDGAWWWVMGVGWLVLLAFAGLLVYLLLVRRSGSDAGLSHDAPAQQVLAQRFASGEIDEDEYRRRRDALRES